LNFCKFGLGNPTVKKTLLIDIYHPLIGNQTKAVGI